MAYPGPVVFNDDDPKPGYTTLFLKVPGLKIARFPPIVGKAKPKNATINENFQTGSAELEITLKDKNGTVVKEFVYKKSMPEDIDPDKSHVEVDADKVILHLCKAKSASWAEHRNFFIDPSQ